ncbi:MAG: hypothetical protein FJX57_09150 [Alphaproteobacteria bacterium]|nr:hypothetical protein [Alphaproteobacteria bacterium]
MRRRRQIGLAVQPIERRREHRAETHDRDLKIDGRERQVAGHHLVRATEALDQAPQARPRLDDQLAAILFDHRQEPHELDRVTVALLAPDEEPASGKALAVPSRQRQEFGADALEPRVQAPFVFPPAFAVTPLQQQQAAETPMRVDHVGIRGDGSPIGILGGRELRAIEARLREVVSSTRAGGAIAGRLGKADGTLERFDRLRPSLRGNQGVAERRMGDGP